MNTSYKEVISLKKRPEGCRQALNLRETNLTALAYSASVGTMLVCYFQ